MIDRDHSAGTTSGLEDPLPGLLRDPQGAQGDLGDLEDPQVVGDGADTDDGLGSVTGRLLDVPGDTGQRQRGTVDPGKVKS